MTEHLIELMQEELLTYLQIYYNFDYQWPTAGSYKVKIFPIYSNLTWGNLHVDPILIDPDWFQFNMTKLANKKNVEMQYIEMSIPLVEDWAAKADVTYRLLWFKISDTLKLSLNNVSASVRC
jgi:hypothetical protein